MKVSTAKRSPEKARRNPQVKKVPVLGTVESDAVRLTPKGVEALGAWTDRYSLAAARDKLLQKQRAAEQAAVRGLDDNLLDAVGRWAIDRQNVRCSWAISDHHTLFGAIDTWLPAPEKLLNSMERRQKVMAKCKPKTVRGLKVLLSAAADILLEREANPEATMGEGPVLEILRQAISALENTPQETRVNTLPA